MNSYFDTTYKFLILGSASVGKTSFLEKYTKKTFDHYQKSTIGIDCCVQTVKIDNKTIKLQIWDTAGQERFKSIVKSFFTGAHGIILMYDVSNYDSFSGISYWLKEISDKNLEVAMILVGNKSDVDEEKRKVSYEKGKELAESLQVPFYETSAMFNKNVKEAIFSLVEQTYKRYGLLNLKTDNKFQVERKKNSNKSSCC